MPLPWLSGSVFRLVSMGSNQWEPVLLRREKLVSVTLWLQSRYCFRFITEHHAIFTHIPTYYITPPIHALEPKLWHNPPSLSSSWLRYGYIPCMFLMLFSKLVPRLSSPIESPHKALHSALREGFSWKRVAPRFSHWWSMSEKKSSGYMLLALFAIDWRTPLSSLRAVPMWRHFAATRGGMSSTSVEMCTIVRSKSAETELTMRTNTSTEGRG